MSQNTHATKGIEFKLQFLPSGSMSLLSYCSYYYYQKLQRLALKYHNELRL